MRRLVLASTAALAVVPTAANAAAISNPSHRVIHHADAHRSPVSPTLQAIAACESGGNPKAVDPSGTYRGKYQFDLQTWRSVGGSGDPASASEAEQDRRAATLLARAGTSPWPVCGA